MSKVLGESSLATAFSPFCSCIDDSSPVELDPGVTEEVTTYSGFSFWFPLTLGVLEVENFCV